MKLLFTLLMICPLLCFAQAKTDTIFANDTYSEFPVGGIPVIRGKGSRVVMDCGMPASRPTTSVRIKMNCGGAVLNDVQPLFVVNDCIMENFTISSLNTADIESITILKDKMAISKYGINAKNGVIEITLKSNTINPITKVETSKPTLRL